MKYTCKYIHIQTWVENIFHSDFVISICKGVFKIARNYPKKYFLFQKPAKSGSAGIWKCGMHRHLAFISAT